MKLLKANDSRRNWYSLGLYIITIGIVSGSNFVSTPLLVRLLDTNSFATWSILEPIVLALAPFAGLGMNVGLIRLAGQSNNQRKSLDNLFLPYICVAAAVSMFGGAISWYITNLQIESLLILGVIFLEGLVLLFISYWRGRGQPLFYAVVEGGRCATLVLLLFLAYAGNAFEITSTMDYLVARTAIACIFLTLAQILVRPAYKIDWFDVKKALSFGFPIVLASMFAALMASVDRYAVSASSNSKEVVEYVTHIKLAQVLTSAVAPYFAWFAPIAIRRLPEGSNAHFFFSTSFYYFFVTCVLICAGLWFMAPALWILLFPNISFQPSLFAVAISSMALFTLGNPLSIGTLQDGKTSFAATISLACCVITTAVCFILVGNYNLMGAALGRLIGSFFYTVLFSIITIRSLNIDYPFGKLFIIGLSTFITCASFSTLTSSINPTYLGIEMLSTFSLIFVLSYILRPRGNNKGDVN